MQPGGNCKRFAIFLCNRNWPCMLVHILSICSHWRFASSMSRKIPSTLLRKSIIFSTSQLHLLHACIRRLEGIHPRWFWQADESEEAETQQQYAAGSTTVVCLLQKWRAPLTGSSSGSSLLFPLVMQSFLSLLVFPPRLFICLLLGSLLPPPSLSLSLSLSPQPAAPGYVSTAVPGNVPVSTVAQGVHVSSL